MGQALAPQRLTAATTSCAWSAALTTEGSATGRALREEPTARAAVEAVLRGNIDMFSDARTPGGCMIALAGANCSHRNGEVAERLAGWRRRAIAELGARLERALREGELDSGTDVGPVAAFYATILRGLSIEARDGVSLDRLRSTVGHAVAPWDSLVRTPAPQP